MSLTERQNVIKNNNRSRIIEDLSKKDLKLTDEGYGTLDEVLGRGAAKLYLVPPRRNRYGRNRYGRNRYGRNRYGRDRYKYQTRRYEKSTRLLSRELVRYAAQNNKSSLDSSDIEYAMAGICPLWPIC